VAILYPTASADARYVEPKSGYGGRRVVDSSAPEIHRFSGGSVYRAIRVALVTRILAFARVPGYALRRSRNAFSSLLCDGTMLRRPSESPSVRREDGCSSTAFGATTARKPSVWDNLAHRVSDGYLAVVAPAVP
jgi:hypothetical protein